MSSDYKIADDGLPARVSGPWAKEKLAYLRKYMSIFTTGMKNNWRRVYLDLMAGPGRCVIKGSNEEFDGSPLVALACADPFDDIALVEEESLLAAALEQRVDGRATVLRRSANDADVINALRDRLGYGRLGLAFVDNLGMEISLDTLRRLTDGRKVDLCITFQVGDLKRNLERALSGEDAERWTAFFGVGWRQIAEDAVSRNLAPAETADRLLDFYGAQLGTFGYDHVRHSRRAMANSRNVHLYRLVLAGKHAQAAHFFDQISNIDPYGQREFQW